MSAQHTPGPWTANTETTRMQVSSRHFAVAYITGVDAEAQANARLIAAAPDLLAALQTIAAGNTDPDVMVEIARAAIAKITGEPQ